jgi:hypothetical protein
MPQQNADGSEDLRVEMRDVVERVVQEVFQREVVLIETAFAAGGTEASMESGTTACTRIVESDRHASGHLGESVDEFLDDAGIELRSGTLAQAVRGLFAGRRDLVGIARGHRHPGVGDLDDT